MTWFGRPWPSEAHPAPACAKEADRVAVPEGSSCAGCGDIIASRDRGVWLGDVAPIHIECLMQSVVGRRGVAESHREAALLTFQWLTGEEPSDRSLGSRAKPSER